MKPKAHHAFLFVYGILKRGFSLDLKDHCGEYITDGFIADAALYRIYSGVGLRLNIPNNSAYGELWEIPTAIWPWLDAIESNGHVYKRKVVTVTVDKAPFVVEAWVYEHMHPFELRGNRSIPSGKYTGTHADFEPMSEDPSTEELYNELGGMG